MSISNSMVVFVFRGTAVIERWLHKGCPFFFTYHGGMMEILSLMMDAIEKIHFYPDTENTQYAMLALISSASIMCEELEITTKQRNGILIILRNEIRKIKHLEGADMLYLAILEEINGQVIN